MKKNKRLLFLSLLVLLVLPGACTPVHSGPDFGPCIASFQDFAFTDRYNSQYQFALPDHPWVAVADIPPVPEGYYSSVPILTYRDTAEGPEIWIAEYYRGLGGGVTDVYLIYNTHSEKWSAISAEVWNTDWRVAELFVTHNGQVWGILRWNSNAGDRPQMDRIPAFGRFNDEMQRFELVEGLEIVTDSGISEVLIDYQGTYWIFVARDGLYRYVAGSDEIEKQFDLPKDPLWGFDAALAPDGSLYYKRTDFSTIKDYTIHDGSMFHYIPETEELITMQLPQEPWPIFRGMVVDHQNRLWLGAIGYRDADESWHFIHPDPQAFINTHAGSLVMPSPRILFESSDGIIWYFNFLDDVMSEGEGTAWYDPETGEGCVITSAASTVVEDSQLRLWLVADKKLYMYDRNR